MTTPRGKSTPADGAGGAGAPATPAEREARLRQALARLVAGSYPAPFDVLGIHPLTTPDAPGRVVRVFLPDAGHRGRSFQVAVRRGDGLHPMTSIHPDGLFEARFPDDVDFFHYTLALTDDAGQTVTLEDPYRFPPVLTLDELERFSAGTWYDQYRRMGAHLITHEGVEGALFVVWAPNAERVSVIGSFNGWDGRRHPMRPRGPSGLWEIFLPGLSAGHLYKYEIRTHHDGLNATKADPFGFFMERRPETASILWSLDDYRWGDDEWLARRPAAQGQRSPVSIYEVHLGSWKRVARPVGDADHPGAPRPADHATAAGADASAEGRAWLTYRQLADELVPYAKEMGFTHLELMPITEHPYDGSWGYQTVGYFAPTSRFGTPDDFRYFVDRAHQAGLGVILDWVPAHFPTDAHGLGYFDGTHLYEHGDPRQGRHMDWGTLIFDFGRPQVCAFLIASALFWIEQYHIDGLRVDAVASMLYLDYSRKPGEWVPNKFGGRENLEAVQFLRDFNVEVHGRFPGVITFAEESTAWPMVSRPVYLGGLGFDFKWNMGWMHDMLAYMSMDPIHRMYHQQKLTFSLFYAFSENFLLPLSHDEVVHGKRSLLSKMPGDIGLRFANLRALYGWMFGHPGKKLFFMGAEIGQWKEWNHDDELDWPLLRFETHQGLKRWLHDLNRLYAAEPALHQVDDSWEGFQWIDCSDVERSIVAALRRASDKHDYLVIVANLTPVARPAYRIGVPAGGGYVELLNSDSAAYGGGDAGNAGYVEALPEASHGLPFCLELMLPPLGVLILKPVTPPSVRAAEEAERLAQEEAARAAEARRLAGEEDALAVAHSPLTAPAAAPPSVVARALQADPAGAEAPRENAGPTPPAPAAAPRAAAPKKEGAPAPKSPRATPKPRKKPLN